MPVIHTEPFARRYVAPLCSFACLAVAVIVVATLILPFVIAYSSRAFWLKENSYREQPTVSFKHSLVLLLGGSTSSSGATVRLPFQLAWSTDPQYNRVANTVVRTPVVKTADVDEDRDGKNDYFQFTISMPAYPGENIHEARLAFFFDYTLQPGSLPFA